jgi:uncharacterized protein
MGNIMKNTPLLLSRCATFFIVFMATVFSFSSTNNTLLAQVPIAPKKISHVVDLEQSLTAAQNAELSKILKSYQKKTKRCFVLVTVKSFDGRQIDDYALELFNTWGIGDKKRNDGLLILFSKAERKVRIQVGSGLESVYSNDFCADIIEKTMIPFFKKQEYYQGIKAGFTQLIEK